MSLYDFACEHCDGTVRERVVDREPISHHRGIVILENVPVGVCDRCGAHYYAAPVLKRVESILTADQPPERTIEVPVVAY
ncbi:MAG TPA: YgiT-type zinc finger protein [Phycisphaerae bacterium]|nr:YgiT-type zinc finger protein [Phycisphaerae bacterium]